MAYSAGKKCSLEHRNRKLRARTTDVEEGTVKDNR
jgi:hypothetical protein